MPSSIAQEWLDLYGEGFDDWYSNRQFRQDTVASQIAYATTVAPLLGVTSGLAKAITVIGVTSDWPAL